MSVEATLADEILSILSILLGGVGLVVPTVDYVYYRRERVSWFSSFIILLFSLLLTLLLSLETLEGPVEAFGGSLYLDFYGSILAFTVTLGALLVSIASFRDVRGWTTSPSFYSLILLALLGVYYMIFLNDLAVLVASWALVSVASYVIAGLKKDLSSVEGAAKYGIMGVASSSIMIYGIALLYSVLGTTYLPALNTLTLDTTSRYAVLAGSILLLASFGFKLGIVPFHGWLPDVYGGVNPILVSYIAGVVKVVGVVAILRVLYPLSNILGYDWFLILALLSIATMTFGNVVALVQNRVQRMMAYSSIAQAGYILIGFAASISASGAKLGLEGVALHVITYVLAKVGVFVGLAYMASRGLELTLDGISGVGRKMPVLSVSFTILLLSLMGIPPLLGFWSKFAYLFLSVVDVAPWLALIAALNSGVSVAYYAQVIRYMYFVEGGSVEVSEKFRDPEVLVVFITSMLTIVLGLGPALAIAPRLIPWT